MASSVKLSSARHLAFRHAQRLMKLGAPPSDMNSDSSDDSDDDESLDSGYELLHSFYVPGLQSGLHTITVTQTIQAGGDPTPLTSTKNFNVVRPRFLLPKDAIHSVYPPQGHHDAVECLPNVVFNDPKLLWETSGSHDADINNPRPPYADYDRNRTPWLAVFVFTEDEVKLSSADLAKTTGIFSKCTSLPNGAVQSPNFAVNMLVSDIPNVASTTFTSQYEPSTDVGVQSDFIFVPPALFEGLFSQYDSSGNAIQNAQPPDTYHPYVYHHRYMAHRRDINTQGMAVSGAVGPDDTGSFGVLVSHRSGPVDISSPATVYVHVVSIQDVEQMQPWPIAAGQRFVAMPSLYSWSYVCMPPNAPNVFDEFRTLGESMQPLAPMFDSKTVASIQAQALGPQILQRMSSGFSLARYRVQTGEQTSCFLRGPFIPVPVPTLPAWWQATSMSGTDLQILDQDFGIMDISYSAAWQLGRTLAIADQPFVAALGNVRKQIYDRGVEDAKQKALKSAASYKSKQDLLASVADTVSKLSQVHNINRSSDSTSLRQRWTRKPVESIDLSFGGDVLAADVQGSMVQAALEVASTPTPGSPTVPSPNPYDEYNTPFSVDWVVVLRWVLDKLHLAGIPSHYLLSDASYLPKETIRFFNVDKNWMDSLIDGALSLANHIDQTGDSAREGIKAAVKKYFATPLSGKNTGYLPGVPCHGCYIRSALITKFPDLKVEITLAPNVPPPGEKQGPVLLSHTIVADDTMLCMFSQPPSNLTWTSLKLTQPPHQQNFIVGESLISTQIEIDYKRAYTVSSPVDDSIDDPFENTPWLASSTGSSQMYCWWQSNANTPAVKTDLRILLVENLASDYLKTLNADIPKDPKSKAQQFKDDTASSALVAYLLNNPCWQLEIDVTGSTTIRSLGAVPSVAPDTLPLRNRPATTTFKSTPTTESSTRDTSPIPQKKIDLSSLAAKKIPSPTRLYRPHIQPIPKLAQNVVGKTNTVLSASGGTVPNIVYYFYPANNPSQPPDQNPVFMGGAPQDIICSITFPKNEATGLNLAYIEIDIPIGPPPTEVGLTKTLTSTVDGVGAFMISNMRFNPRLIIASDNKTLQVFLRPRSTTGGVSLVSCTDLSFMLTGIRANSSSLGYYNVVPTITEQYLNSVKSGPAQRQNQNPVPQINLKPAPPPSGGSNKSSTAGSSGDELSSDDSE